MRKNNNISPFSNTDRINRIEACQQKQYDLIVIGGGITGAGIAFDASHRGLSVLLVEKKDFASGTSSKSTKLIHGGLRYLKQLELGLVRETGLERAIAHHNICHLVHPEQMLLPIVKGGTFSAFTAGLAIGVYDMLADVPKEYRKKKLSKSKTLERAPLLAADMVKSGIVYSEYRTDDARLTIELIKAAREKDAEAYNYLEVSSFTYDDNGNIAGVKCYDHILGRAATFKAKKIVSSTGPWVDKLRQKDDSSTTKNLHLSKGVHIVVARDRFPLDTSTYFDAFDGRMIFAIPRGQIVYIGTTDTTLNDDMENLRCEQKDASYLIKATNAMFPSLHLAIEDIDSTWTGLRPLIFQEGKSAKELSRKDEIFISDSGLISIAGGKLTGFRKMAKRIVDLVMKTEDSFKFVPCSTKQKKIHARPFSDYTEFLNFQKELSSIYDQLNEHTIWFLSTTYGKDAKHIINQAMLGDDTLPLKERIVISQLDYTIDNESVYHPLDFFNRRTGWMYFDIDKVKNYRKLVVDNISKRLALDTNKEETVSKEVENSITKHAVAYLKK